MKKVNEKGFTLAELLIVVAIIGVLVAMAIPTFTNQLEKARESTDMSNLRSAFSAATVYVLENQSASARTLYYSATADGNIVNNEAAGAIIGRKAAVAGQQYKESMATFNTVYQYGPTSSDGDNVADPTAKIKIDVNANNKITCVSFTSDKSTIKAASVTANPTKVVYNTSATEDAEKKISLAGLTVSVTRMQFGVEFTETVNYADNPALFTVYYGTSGKTSASDTGLNPLTDGADAVSAMNGSVIYVVYNSFWATPLSDTLTVS